MDELIKINENRMVDAEELHKKLGVDTRFRGWMPRRIEGYNFLEGEDFRSFLGESNGGRRSTGYSLSLDMAKELCMVEKTPKGKEVRKYFIEIEKRYREEMDSKTPAEILLMHAQEVVRIEQEQKKLQEDNRQIKKDLKELKDDLPQQVADVLDTLTINVRPTGTINLTEIRSRYFKGMSGENISIYLKKRQHPFKMMPLQHTSKEVTEVEMFVEEGLKELFNTFLSECTWLKDTGKNYKLSHPAIDRTSFRLNKEEIFLSKDLVGKEEN